MTEPEVSGSDPTTLQTRGELDGDEWVIDGHKWFTSGAVGASMAIVMCVTDPDAHPYARASMILVPTDNPGFDLVRPSRSWATPAARALRDPLRGLQGADLEPARRAGRRVRDRPGPAGPGRIHHCMRAIGTAERAIELMCRRRQ